MPLSTSPTSTLHTLGTSFARASRALCEVRGLVSAIGAVMCSVHCVSVEMRVSVLLSIAHAYNTDETKSAASRRRASACAIESHLSLPSDEKKSEKSAFGSYRELSVSEKVGHHQ